MSPPAKTGPPHADTPRPLPLPPQPPSWRKWLVVVGIVVTAVLLVFSSWRGQPGSNTAHLTYSQFVTDVRQGKVASIDIDSNGGLHGRLTSKQPFDSAVPTAVPDTTLLPLLAQHNVAVKAVPASRSWVPVLLSFLPFLFFIALFLFIGRAVRKQATGVGGFLGGVRKSRAKHVTADMPKTTFADVAGYEATKAEINEVVDYLRDPRRYRRAGAVGPRGVLLTGPPGTGKTLLGRAVAGEAGVPFLAVTGSAFVEMFVGVGASRVRDTFEQARSHGSAIVFIDEIDAIGARRTSGVALGANDEREQTLNQLLAELDGFEPGKGIVVLAATNRPEVLDPALLRPGRFDRHIVVPLPNQAERAAILRVHCRDKQQGSDVDLSVVARGTPGFSGADLANLANEAAIVAVRHGRAVLNAGDFAQARERIMLGQRTSTNALLPDEQRVVAFHEAGHALVAALSSHADPVAKVSILPAGMALGVTEQLPLDERHLYGEGYLYDTLAVRLGGRCAEILTIGEASSGAANDLAGATQLATRMVTEFGLSPALGPVGYSSGSPQYLGEGPPEHHPYSDDTQRVVDREVARLVREAEQRATEVLRTHRDELEELAILLMEHETVDGDAIYQLIGRAAAPGDGAGTVLTPAAGEHTRDKTSPPRGTTR